MDSWIPVLVGKEEPSDETIAAFRADSRALFESLLAKSAVLARGGAEIVVWSEASVAVIESDEQALLERARAVAIEQGIFLGITPGFAGVDFRQKLVAGEPFIRNALIMIRPDGTVAWEYLKSRLVPGMPEATTSVAGDGVIPVVETRFGDVAGAICYDLDFPNMIRSVGRNGASLLVAPSNDWPEIKVTHSRLARVRAIENGISLLRPTSSGISFVADPYGRIVAEVDYFMSDGAPLVAEAPIQRVDTVYSVIGDLFAYLSMAAVLLLMATAIRWPRRDS